MVGTLVRNRLIAIEWRKLGGRLGLEEWRRSHAGLANVSGGMQVNSAAEPCRYGRCSHC